MEVLEWAEKCRPQSVHGVKSNKPYVRICYLTMGMQDHRKFLCTLENVMLTSMPHAITVCTREVDETKTFEFPDLCWTSGIYMVLINYVSA